MISLLCRMRCFSLRTMNLPTVAMFLLSFNFVLISAWHETTPPTPKSEILLVTMGGTKSHKIPFWALAKGLIAK